MTRGKLTRTKRARLERLEALAVRKLGAGTVVRAQRSGWIAERVDGQNRRMRVGGGTWKNLEWVLNQMPDLHGSME